MTRSIHIANQIYVLIVNHVINYYIYIECSCCELTKLAPSRQLCYLLEQLFPDNSARGQLGPWTARPVADNSART